MKVLLSVILVSLLRIEYGGDDSDNSINGGSGAGGLFGSNREYATDFAVMSVREARIQMTSYLVRASLSTMS